ncbi:MAG: aspartyl protease family protein [Fluviicola sp.]
MTNGSIKSKDYTQTVPFELRKDLIIVSAFLNNDSTAREFIFDTGAFNSKVEYELAESLGLEVIAEKQNGTAQGITRRIEVVRLDSLKLGDTWISNAGAGKLKYDSLSASPCVAGSGIIGANIIKLAHWKLDYKEQRLHFSDTPFEPSNNAGVLPFKRPLLSGTPTVNLKVGNREVQNVLFDVGFNGGLVLPISIASAFPNAETDTIYDRSTSGIYGTNTDTLLVKYLQVEVAGFTSTIPVEFSSLNKALLGNGFLKHFDVIINYKKDEIYLDNVKPVSISPGAHLILAPNATNCWEVTRTSAKVPFQLGDTFVRVNGKKPSEVFTDFCDYVMRRAEFFDGETLLLETENGEVLEWGSWSTYN